VQAPPLQTPPEPECDKSNSSQAQATGVQLGELSYPLPEFGRLPQRSGGRGVIPKQLAKFRNLVVRFNFAFFRAGRPTRRQYSSHTSRAAPKSRA